jgi:hypothetical protein
MKIQENYAVIHCAQRCFGVVDPLHPIDSVIGALQVRGDGVAKNRLVLDQENAHGDL